MPRSFLAFRPPNVVNRAGVDSMVPIVGLRHMLSQEWDASSMFLTVPIPLECSIPGVLFAGRVVEAPVILGVPFRPGDRNLPDRFFQSVLFECERVSHQSPVILQGGPVRIGPDSNIEELSEDVFRYVDAGITLISLDASRVSLDSQLQTYTQLLARARSLEFSLEVSVPISDEGIPSPDSLSFLLAGLADDGIRVDSVRVASWQLVPPKLPEAEVDLNVLSSIVDCASQFEAHVCIEDSASDGVSSASAWKEAGVAKIDAFGSFSDVLFRQIDPDERVLWSRRGWPLGMTGAEWLALRPDIGGELTEELRLRVEALSFAETMAWIEAVGLRSSASEFLNSGATEFEES